MLIKGDSLNHLPKVASDIIAFAEGENIWVLQGEMGAGKTTLTKALGKQLGVLDTMQSPTFSIVNEYLTQNGETVFHFDFYRIENPEEAMAIGVEEYFYSGNLCIIEWPERIGGLIPEKFLKIEIENLEGEQRNYKLSKHG